MSGFLNELSLEVGRDPNVRPLFVGLLATISASCLRLQVVAGVIDSPVMAGKSIRHWIYFLFESPADTDLRGRLARALLDTIPIEEGNKADWMHGNQSAAGLTAALRTQGLAVSFEGLAWIKAQLPLHEAGNPGRQVMVRHASTITHAGEHQNWLNQSAPPTHKLQRRLNLGDEMQHHPASQYGGGKHVKKSTNEGRRNCAASIGGPAQYIAEWNGTPIHDSHICAWEKKVLSDARSGTLPATAIVQEHVSTFFVYAQLDHVVGYEGGTGKETRWIRVEISGRHIHSHPHQP